MNFEELNLAPAILKAVLEQGYETPTPIQAQAIPAVLAGQDLLAGAQTGTGKTAAFTLPMLHKLTMSRSTENKFGVYGVRALVLTPTRELAAQVEESVRTYGKYLQLTSAVIFGGVGMNPQIARIQKGVDILVATPGRLLDLQQQGELDLSTVQMLVLDEADRMLDMGFIHDVKKILALVPKDKQSLLFSATFSDEIRELANGLLKNPQSIQVTPSNTTVQSIKQIVHPVGRGKKKALLAHIINEHNWSQVLCSHAPSLAPTMWPNTSPKTASTPWPCTATKVKPRARKPWRVSRAVTSAPWLLLTLRHVVSILTNYPML